MKITIDFLTGKTVTVEVDSSDTIADLKAKIKESGTSTERMRLIYDGKALEDSKTIADYDIKEENTVISAMRLLN